ncbi:MAG: type II toxin-antitoxin system RelE/ParE family toxin [Chitinophagaceae bacterium]|uniref:type II toxin-antitoxin system RelE/ParE family toxin n=1 Tax=Terrimonas ginsenosidimutans TaxID=2908004 RepID=UPI00347004B7
MPYEISNAAKNDLENIWQYTFENWSIDQADLYVSLILKEMELLGNRPGSGRDFGHIRKNYRSSRIKSHTIFYRTIDNATHIEIIRILHQSMDITKHL